MSAHRYKLLIEYDGGGYHGWQRQAELPTVQQAIETAIAKFSGETPRITGAGRTDTGVHATGQVAHVDLARRWPADTVRDAINAHLKQAGERVAVLAASSVPPGFDARMSARRRRYRYVILNRRAPLALERARAWHIARPLDLAAMRLAAPALLGWHDFTTFRGADCQANGPLRTLERFDIEADGERVEIAAAARSFLHHQVRGMVGSLVQVGLGRWPVEALSHALAARDRARCGPLAPPHGLRLEGVDYAEESAASTAS